MVASSRFSLQSTFLASASALRRMSLALLSIKRFEDLMVSVVLSNSASKLSTKDRAEEVEGDRDNSDMVTLPERIWLSSSSILKAREVSAAVMALVAVATVVTLDTGADGTTAAFDALESLRLEQVVAGGVADDDIL